MTSAPIAERRPLTREAHGVQWSDPYAWLRAENWREAMRDPAVLPADIRAYLEAENAYADAWFAPQRRLVKRLVKEMRGRIKEDDTSPPSPDGAYAYFTRFRTGGQHPLFCRKPSGTDGPETILLDGDKEARGTAFFSLGSVVHSDDHKLLAWSVDTNGSELYTIRVRHAETGQALPDSIVEAEGSVVFTSDATAFYYVKRDAEHRPSRVFRHVLGTDQAADVLVFEEADPGFFVGIGRTNSRAFLVIDCHGHSTSEARLLRLDQPDPAQVLIAARETGVEYSVDHHGETLFIRTNADGARDFKLVTAPVSSPDRAHWRDLVAHRDGIYVLSHDLFADWLVRMEREDGLPRLVVRALVTGEEHSVAFDEEAYALGGGASYEFATDTLRFGYASMTTPNETWDYNMRTRTRVLVKRQDIPSGHNPADYVTKRVFARATDGETVPVTLLWRADAAPTQESRVLLYGYGAYGMAMSASFRSGILSLVDRGFVYAIAHVRGGTEKGRRWYEEGKLSRKPNTFSDFIAAAEHLIEAGIGAPGRIVAHGGSAGGMLMGAVLNLRPDLFAGIVGEVPFVDVLVTMLDETLPLTPPEWPEWGDPIRDPKAFASIRSYSPIDNVRAGPKPAVFALAGLSDPRVTYWEPAKWVATLRASDHGPAPILLRTNMGAGHGGASGRFDRLEEVALVFAFALAVTEPKNRRVWKKTVSAVA